MKGNLNKFLGLVCLNFVIGQAFAVPNVITFVKNNCWLDYQVHFRIHDRTTGKHLGEVVIPKNQAWARVQFDAAENQVLAIQASFSPAIFEADKGRMYPANRFWKMPDNHPIAGSVWTFNVCFDQEFANAPMPPSATGNCACDFSRIPAIVPKEVVAK